MADPARHAPASSTLLPALALVFNAGVWGLSWWPFRALHDRGVHPLWATAAVFILALAVVLLLRPRALPAMARQPMLWLLAAATGATNVGFNWAVTVGDVVRVVLLFYLMPAWSVLLAWALLGQRPSGASLLRLALALAGVAIVLWPADGGWPSPRGLADGLALLGGFSFALTNLLLLRLRERPAPERVVAMFGGGAATALVVAWVGTAQGALAAPGWSVPGAGLLVLLLAAGFLCSNLALQYGASRLAAQTTALIMLSELLFASVSSAAAGASELTARTLVGGLLIVATAAWAARAHEPAH